MKYIGVPIAALLWGFGLAHGQLAKAGVPSLLLEPEKDATVWLELTLPSEPDNPDLITEVFAAILEETDPEFVAEIYDGVFDDDSVAWSDYWYGAQELGAFYFAGELNLEPLRDELRHLGFQQLHVEVRSFPSYTTDVQWRGEAVSVVRQADRYTAVLSLESSLPRLQLKCTQSLMAITQSFLPFLVLTALFASFILWLRWYFLRWPAEEAGYAAKLCTRLHVSGVVAFGALLACMLTILPPFVMLSAWTSVGSATRLWIAVLWSGWFTLMVVAAHAYLLPIYQRLPGVSWRRGDLAAQAFWCCALLILPILAVGQLWELVRLGPLHVLGGMLLIGVLILCVYTRILRAIGLHRQALLEGELRARLDSLARNANIPPTIALSILHHPSPAVANAFAHHGTGIVITEQSIECLTRREADGLLAHKLARLIKKHPTKCYQRRNLLVALGAILGAGIGYAAYTLVLNTPFQEYTYPLEPMFVTIGGLAGAQLGALKYYAFARQCENEADVVALRMTGDTEGMIAGILKLTRLNLHPLDSSSDRIAWFSAQPSVQQRVERLAALGNISPGRLAQLLDGDAVGEGHYGVPASASRTRIFSTQRKNYMNQTSLLKFLVASAILPATIAYAVQHLVPATPILVPATCLLMIAASFLTLLAHQNRSAMQDLKTVGIRLRERFGIAPSCGTYVTMAPGDTPQVFDGSVHWDAGFLAWNRTGLDFLGEAAAFTIPRESIVTIVLDPKPTLPLFHTRLRVQFKQPGTSETQFVAFTEADGRSLLDSNRKAQELYTTLKDWQQDGGVPGATALPGAPYAPPDTLSICGTPLSKVFAIPRILLLVALASIAGFTFGGALQLNELKPFEASMLNAGLASGLGALLIYLPVWIRTRRETWPANG